LSKRNEYGGKRVGDVILAERMLFSQDGVNDDELAETLDYQIEPESAVLWCRRQDARAFKHERCSRKGALVFSLPVEGEEKPRYYEISVIKRNRPADKQLLRKRALRSIKRQISAFIEIEYMGDTQRAIFNASDEIVEIVREMLAAAIQEKFSKKSA
jgi:hypothetical protein